jgi:hypothetical protein
MKRPTFTTTTTADPVAAEVNARIRAQAERFEIEPGTPLKFLCECGCMSEFVASAAAYDAATSGVLAPGHRLRRSSVVERLADRARTSRFRGRFPHGPVRGRRRAA